MARNLKWQFLNAINSNFKEGMDKHSIKADGQMNGTRIFSYADRENLKDVASNFSNYMKENHSEIKMVKDIKPEHIQNFLNSKANNCSRKTLEQYGSKFNKLENLVNSTYGTNASYKGFVVPATVEQTKIRNVAMSKSDFKKLENGFSNSKSSAKEAIQLTSKLGLRVSECTKLQGRDINLEKGTVHVADGKGGRDRDVKIRPEDKGYFANLKASVGDRERICPVQNDSINKAVQRQMERVGIANKYQDTSIHAIRKMYAQEQYDRYREQGLEINQALGQVSVDLGHSENRLELMREYVLDIK
ncbi:integrase domain-containing protein [Clostridium perfringens]|nr:integrase domain-containing protein [Clostridium perfringens]